ncbi:leucine-rich repeat protein [Ruminococcus sp. NK3A76]|uniref:leucine-rich repeat protein n=1 Tax=Ruminococcus sp. NK3A76 TaxID=877411 RepID=UPI0005618BEE|nr:leucine-rich repeat protein [Ruminococcus sp. NK3A76]
MKKIVTFILTLGFILATKPITASAKVDMFQTDMVEDEAQVLSTIITDNMTEYQKMKAISQYVHDNYHEYSCICHTSAVYELATEAGIQCWALHPFETTATNGHVCNMAILDGKYYKVDGQINQILEESDLWILTTHGNGDTGIWKYIDNFPETLTIPSKALNSKNELVDITYISRGFSSSAYDVDIPDITRQKFNLKTVKISEGITTIENHAFRDLTKLETIYIPSTVTYIEPLAFDGCSALKNVIIDPKNTVYTVANGCIIKNKNELVYKYDYNKVDTLTIPDNITTITDGSLGCWFTNICIPKSVTYINDEIGISWKALSNKKIYGVPGSYAEEFANKYDILFIDINKGVIGTLTNDNVELTYSSYVYRGYEIKPEVTVTFNNSTLKENVDYTVSYSNNINAGTAKVTVTGIGDYNGTVTKTFNISKRSLTDASIKVNDNISNTVDGYYSYNGSTTTPTLESGIKLTNTTYFKTINLVAGTDYTISMNGTRFNNRILDITITGKGNYTGSVDTSVAIKYTPAITNISTCTATFGTTSYTYDGAAKTPTVTVKNGSTTLKNRTDYTVSYSNNINAGTAAVTITGKGNYTGTISKTFTINKKDLSTTTITLSQNSYKYDGNAKKPTVTVKIGSTAIPATGYNVSYSNNVNAGTAKVTVTGKNNYTGSVSVNFTITKATESETTEPVITKPDPEPEIITPIANCSVTLSASSFIYTGSVIKPNVTIKNGSVTLVNGTDYTVSYNSNINAGTGKVTITGKGNYTGSVSKSFTITRASIAKATVSGLSNKYYTGKAIAQTPVVKLGSKTLKAGTDYTVSYKSNKAVGTATVTITGKGNYTGSVSKSFTITRASIAKATVSGLSNKTYTGKAITHTPVVKLGSKTLKAGTDYTVSYKSNKAVGTATVTITGKGNYSGTVKATFKINPKKTTLKSVTSPKTKQLKATYSKVSGVTGYQISYSTSAKFTKATTKTASSTATSKTISKLTKGKTYYVRVRSYKTVNGTKYYSGWSAVKKIKYNRIIAINMILAAV